MPQLLHYPQHCRTLTDVAQQACINPNDIDNYAQVLAKANYKQPNDILSPFTPVILPENRPGSSLDSTVRIPRCTVNENKRLATLNRQIGGAGTLALADLVWEITKDGAHNAWQFSKQNATTFGSGGGVALVQTSNMLLNSIDEYQRELTLSENLIGHNAADPTIKRQKIKEKAAFDRMYRTLDRKGQQFMHKYTVKTRQVKSLTGKIMTQSIPLSDSTYYRNLTNLAKMGKVVAPGLVLLDGYLRYDGVIDMYRANNPKWKRQAVVETTSFTAGLLAAGAIASIVVAMTPAGLLVGFVVGGMAAVGFDLMAKETIGVIYDGF